VVLSWIRLEHGKIWIRFVDDDVKAELHLFTEIINEKFQIGYQTIYVLRISILLRLEANLSEHLKVQSYRQL